MKRNRAAHNPVADWDGLCTTPAGLWTPEQMQENARRTLDAMDRHAGVKRQDEAEKSRPIHPPRRHWLDGPL